MKPEPKKSCRACAHSYMEPDSDLICGAVNLPWGRITRKDGEHCNGGELFEQHPRRTEEGLLK